MLHLLNSRRRFRSSTRRKNSNPRRSFESLESRQVMAGNITAVVDTSGNLTITGDDADNGLYITQIAQGEFLIGGLDANNSATTINGSAEFITLKNVTGAITINTGAGNDITQFDYFNHTGNLTIDTQIGQDLVNVGTSNRKSSLTGDITVSFSQASTLNLLNTTIDGAAKFEYVGPAEAEVLQLSPRVTPLPNPFDPPQPPGQFFVLTFPCSFAITGCTFSQDVSIRANLQQVQVFIESTQITRKLIIDNSGFDAINENRNTYNSSFIVLNNVSAKLGLDATLHSSTSFVINNSNFDHTIDPPPRIPLTGPSSVWIKMYGKHNILQITNTFFRDGLLLENYLRGSTPVGNEIPPIVLQSEYDVIQLDGVQILGRTSVESNGNVSVKNSHLGYAYLQAKNWVEIIDTTAAQVFTNVTTAQRGARTTIDGCLFAMLSVTSNYRSAHLQTVRITDTKVVGTAKIGGRSGFERNEDVGNTYTAVISPAAAKITITNSEFNTLSYSYEKIPSARTLDPLATVGGAGVDTLEIRNSKIFNKLFAQLGDGDDTIFFSGTTFAAGGYVDGGEGTDGSNDPASLGPVAPTFVNFEETLVEAIPLN